MTTSTEKDVAKRNQEHSGAQSTGASTRNVPASGNIVPGGPNGPDGTVIEEVMTTVVGKKQPVRGQAYRAQNGDYVSYLCNDDEALYRPGDSVYIESQRADQPYFICSIQEFRRSKRDNLMVNIKWFYRPSEVPETVYQLLVQDRNTENNNRTLAIDHPEIKSRELFISEATDTYPVSVLRGTCKVEHYADIHAVREFKPESDSFFYILGYNPETRRLASTQGEIRIGPSHQAKLPEYRGDVPAALRPEKCSDWEEIRWIPHQIEDSDLLMFLKAARSMAAFAGICDQGPNGGGHIVATKDAVTINALNIIHECNYDKNESLNTIVKCPIPQELEKKWSEDDVRRFVKGIRSTGKNFFRIKNDLEHKTTKDLVFFYYCWKKTISAQGHRPPRRHRRPNALRRIRNPRTTTRNVGNADPLDPDSTSEKEDDSDDSDSKDRQGYHCRHCYTTSSRDWHHAGKDKQLLCYDCRMHFKHYGELPVITNPRDPPPAVTLRQSQNATKEETGIRTRTRAKELSSRSRVSLRSRANTPDTYDDNSDQKSASNNSPGPKKTVQDDKNSKFKRGRSVEEDPTDTPIKKKYQNAEASDHSGEESLEEEDGVPSSEGLNSLVSSPSPCVGSVPQHQTSPSPPSGTHVDTRTDTPKKHEIDHPENETQRTPADKTSRSLDEPQTKAGLGSNEICDLMNSSVIVPPKENSSKPLDASSGADEVQTPSDLSMQTAPEEAIQSKIGSPVSPYAYGPTDLSSGTRSAHLSSSRVYPNTSTSSVITSTAGTSNTEAIPSSPHPPPAHSSLHAPGMPVHPAHPPAAHALAPPHPTFGPLSLKTSESSFNGTSPHKNVPSSLSALSLANPNRSTSSSSGGGLMRPPDSRTASQDNSKRTEGLPFGHPSFGPISSQNLTPKSNSAATEVPYSPPSISGIPAQMLPNPLPFLGQGGIINAPKSTIGPGPKLEPPSDHEPSTRLELEHLRFAPDVPYPYHRANPDTSLTPPTSGSASSTISGAPHSRLSQPISPPNIKNILSGKPWPVSMHSDIPKKEFDSFKEKFKSEYPLDRTKTEVKREVKQEIKQEPRPDKDKPEIIAEVKAEHKMMLPPFSSHPSTVHPHMVGLPGYPFGSPYAPLQPPYLPPAKSFGQSSPSAPAKSGISTPPPGPGRPISGNSISPAHLSSPFIPGKPAISAPSKISTGQPSPSVSLKSPMGLLGHVPPPPAAHTGPVKPPQLPSGSSSHPSINRHSPAASNPYAPLAPSSLSSSLPGSQGQPPTTQALPPTVPPNHPGFSSTTAAGHEGDDGEDAESPQNRDPSPPPKIEDSEFHRTNSAIFLKHWNRGDYNSCARTDLIFKPVPTSNLHRKREERERKTAEREREEKDKARKKSITPEGRDLPKPSNLDSLASPGNLYDRIIPRPTADPGLARLGSMAGPSGMRPTLPMPPGLPGSAGPGHFPMDPILQHYNNLASLYPMVSRDRFDLERDRDLSDRLKEEMLKRSHLDPHHPGSYVNLPHHPLLSGHRFHPMAASTIPSSFNPAPPPPAIYGQPPPSSTANIIAAERDRMDRMAAAASIAAYTRPGLMRPGEGLPRMPPGFPASASTINALNRQYEEQFLAHEHMQRQILLERERLSHLNPSAHFRP